MSKTMTLRSRCTRCDGAVELGFLPWTGNGPATAADWACPSCACMNQVPAIGTVTWVDVRPERADKPDRNPTRTH